MAFLPDYALLFRRGAGKFDFDYAQMNQTAVDADEFVDIYFGFDNSIDSGGAFPLIGPNSGFEFNVAYDPSNVAGVTGGTQAADQAAAAAVTTGTELSIPLAALGNPTDDIKVSAFISSGSFDFLSNQFLAGLETEDFDNDPATPEDRGNLGGFYDLSVVPGDQFFTISLGETAGIVGDFDNSGQVEQGDLTLVLSNWGQDAPFTDPGGTAFLVAAGRPGRAVAGPDQLGQHRGPELRRLLRSRAGHGRAAGPGWSGDAASPVGVMKYVFARRGGRKTAPPIYRFGCSPRYD